MKKIKVKKSRKNIKRKKYGTYTDKVYTDNKRLVFKAMLHYH